MIHRQHSPSRRTVVYGLILGLASLGWFLLTAATAQAVEIPAVHLDESAVAGGKTLTLNDGSKAGIFTGALPGPADVQWTTSQEIVPPLPDHRSILGSAYRLTISGVTQLNAITRPLAITIPAGHSYWNRQIWRYDRTTRIWSPLVSNLQPVTNFFSAPTNIIDGMYAVLENRQQEEGIASWYCHYHCSPRYPTYHGTSNDYPVGSMVKVRSLETGRTITVKIISRWGQPAGRVIDLSYTAYAALGAKNRGVTRVVVTPASAKVLEVATITPSPTETKPESIPQLQVSDDGTPAPEAVQAPAYAVYDQTSDTLLAGRRADAVRPIASITKLMTVMVFLDTKTSFDKVLAYDPANNTHCSCLYLNSGETVTVRDLFYATLVGSANNAALSLVQSTGLSTADFVTKMNAKAQALGLTHTIFLEPTGLNPGNVSTATDVAHLAAYALHNYQPIRYVTTRHSYTFTTINTGRTHTIYLRYSMYGPGLPMSGLEITGGKTGYLDESLYTYALRVKNAQGAQVVTVVLGSPSVAQRLNDLTALVGWTFGHHTWK